MAVAGNQIIFAVSSQQLRQHSGIVAARRVGQQHHCLGQSPPVQPPLERVTALDRRHTHSVPAVAAAAPTLLNAFATREHGYSTLNRYFDGGRPVLPQLAFEAAHLQGEDG
jgi:hypothetical protein